MLRTYVAADRLLGPRLHSTSHVFAERSPARALRTHLPGRRRRRQCTSHVLGRAAESGRLPGKKCVLRALLEDGWPVPGYSTSHIPPPCRRPRLARVRYTGHTTKTAPPSRAARRRRRGQRRCAAVVPGNAGQLSGKYRFLVGFYEYSIWGDLGVREQSKPTNFLENICFVPTLSKKPRPPLHLMLAPSCASRPSTAPTSADADSLTCASRAGAGPCSTRATADLMANDTRASGVVR